MIKKILNQIKKGTNNKNTISQKTDISKRLLEAIFEEAIRKNYIKQISYEGKCKNCPFNTTCNTDQNNCTTIKTYKLTKKGEKYLKQKQ